MLRATIGGREASRAVVIDALTDGPSLVIDCANACDPYAYLDVVAPEAFETTHVIGFDMLTSLTDALSEAPRHLERLGTDRLRVTSTARLFHYRDEEENASVRARAWKLMRGLAQRYDVLVAVERGTTDEGFARLNAACEETMGHTVSSQRKVAEDLKETLTRYARAMRAEDRAVLERLTSLPFKHVASLSYASSIHTWALYLLSIILEQEKELERLRAHTGLRARGEEQRGL